MTVRSKHDISSPMLTTLALTNFSGNWNKNYPNPRRTKPQSNNNRDLKKNMGPSNQETINSETYQIQWKLEQILPRPMNLRSPEVNENHPSQTLIKSE
jgi:hypothetical protein